MKVDYVLDSFQVCVSEEDPLDSFPVLFDVQMIPFQAAKAAACQGVGHLSSPSAVPCPQLWARLSPGKNMLFFHGLGEFNPKKKKQIAQKDLFGSSTSLPHHQGLSCGCRNHNSFLQPMLCVGQFQPAPASKS